MCRSCPTYYVGDDSGQQKVLLVLMRALLQALQSANMQTSRLSSTYHFVCLSEVVGNQRRSDLSKRGVVDANRPKWR